MNTKSKIFSSIAILGSAVFAMVLSASTGLFEALGIFNRTTTNSNATTIVLDKNNAYTSGTSKQILTTFGKNPITFDYSSCSSLSEGHSVIGANGTIGNHYSSSSDTFNNKITSIESIVPVFTSPSGSLQFRASYNGRPTGDWGDFAPLTSGKAFTLESKPYYIELKAADGAVNLTSLTINFSCVENPSATGTPKYETSLTINDGEKKTYSSNDIFDNLIGGSEKSRAVIISDSFDVVQNMSDKTTKTLKKGDFTYRVTNPSGSEIDTSKEFGTTGTYTAYIKAGSLPEISAKFEVSAILIESISIPTALDLNTNNEETLTATISPANASNKTLSWSSTDESVATVDGTGKVTAHNAGQTKIKASSTDGSDKFSNECTVTVTDIQVTSIDLSKTSLTMKTNQSETITATVNPSTATDKTITWSSNNESVAAVSNGTISSHSEGEATITATTSNGVNASCVVTVSDDEPADPDMKTAYEIADDLPDGDYTYSAYPFSGIVVGTRTSVTTRKTTTSKDVFVQSGDYGLDLFNSGYEPSYKDKVSASATLTKYSGLVETKVVSSLVNNGQVKLPKAKQITSASVLENTKLNTLVDVYGTVKSMSLYGSDIVKTKDLTIQLTTANGDVQVFVKKNCFDDVNTTFKDFGNGDTMTIKNGIKGIYNSTHQILIVNESIVSRTVIDVTGVNVSPETTAIFAGSTVALTANVLPVDATNKSVSWSSNDTSIATVNSDGVVTGVNPGTTTITARTADGGFSDTCRVTVNPVSVTGVTLNSQNVTITQGNTEQLNATVAPSNASNKNVSWSSNNTGVATVSSSGLVAAVAPGNAIITVTTEDGNKTATCSVTVKAPVVLSSITVSGYKTSFTQGDEFLFNGTVTAHYSDSSTGNVTNNATFSGYNMANVGTQTVTVSYQGKTTTYQITVSERIVSLTEISVSSNHRTFTVGDTFVKETVTAHYDDNSTKDVTNTAVFSSVNMSTIGTPTVTVSYTEKTITKTTSYTINIRSSSATHDDIIINENLEGMANGYSSSDGSHSADNDYTVVTSDVCVQNHNLQFRTTPGYIYNTTDLPIYTVTLSNNSSSFHVYAGNSEHPTQTEIIGNNGVYEMNGAPYFTVKGDGSTCQVTSITLTFGTPTPVNPTSISITGTNQLTAGQQGQLSLTFAPSNCNQKDVTWSSSNSVVSVDQTGKITASSTAVVGQSAVITATSKVVGTVKGTITVTIVDKPVVPKADWTIMVYVCGSNLESDGSSATNDILEMLDVNGIGGDGADINVILETGGCTRWRMGRANLSGQNSISSSEIQRWEINGGKMVYKETDTAANNILSTQSTLERFLKWGIDNYAAEKYGLIMWNHGGGIAGCCYDDNYLDSDDYAIALSTADVAKAAETAVNYGDFGKFELIAYDCCLMQCADIASVNADYFNYMAASQETEWDGGYDYDVWLDYLVDNPTVDGGDLGNIIVKSFIDEQNKQGHRDQQSSVLDLSKMSTLTSDFNSFVSSMNLQKNNYSTITNLFEQCTGFGLDEETGGSCYGLCDFKQLVNKLGTSFSQTAKANTVINDLNNVVIHNYYGSKFNTASPCGLNAFVPHVYGFDACQQASKAFYTGSYNTKFTGWQTFMLKYGTWDF